MSQLVRVVLVSPKEPHDAALVELHAERSLDDLDAIHRIAPRASLRVVEVWDERGSFQVNWQWRRAQA